jgi:methyl-accepting chemotaxis protein
VGRAISAILVAGALLVAACGGEEESPSEAWAGDFCSAAADWRSSIDEAIAQVGDPADLSFNTLRGAIDDGLAATEAFIDDVRALGPPETEAGQEAAGIVDSMTDDLDADVDELRSALETESESAPELLEKAGQASTLIGQMAQQLQSSVQELEGLEPADELRSALEENEDCEGARAGS